MTIRYYNIDGEEITLEEWGRLFEIAEYRIVRHTKINDILVSTVWLGIDHRFRLDDAPGEAPVIFETMVFDHSIGNGLQRYRDLECRRYCTFDQAVAGHEEMVDLVHKLEGVNECGTSNGSSSSSDSA